MDNLIIASEEDLQSFIDAAVKRALNDKLPEVIRKSTRKKWYSIDETCELLNVSRRHLQYLRDSGQIGYVKNGRKVYFKAEDLENFFSDNYIEAEV